MRLPCATHANLLRMSKMIQLRHVPDDLHRRPKTRAALSGLPLSNYLIREVRKIAELPSAAEMAERLQQRAPYKGKIGATEITRSGRQSLIVTFAGYRSDARSWAHGTTQGHHSLASGTGTRGFRLTTH
jgi:antitoxin FitA